MSFAPKPKPIFPIMGPYDKKKFQFKPKAQAHSFHGLFGTWCLEVLIMGVMGLGENGLKVHERLDMAIFPPPPPNPPTPKQDKSGYRTCAPRLQDKKLSCFICRAIIKFHNVTMPSSWMTIVDVLFHNTSPDYQGPRTKPCKVSNMTLTKFVRCPGPCSRE